MKMKTHLKQDFNKGMTTSDDPGLLQMPNH